MGQLRRARRGSTVLVVRAMSRAAIYMRWTTMCIYGTGTALECTQPEGLFTRTMTFPNEPVPRTSRMSYCFFLFADGGCAITFWETSENIFVVVAPILYYPNPEWGVTVILSLSTFEGGFLQSDRARNGGRRCAGW